MQSVHQRIQDEQLHQLLTLEQQEDAGIETGRRAGAPSEEDLLAHQQQLRANLQQQQEQQRQEQEERRRRAKEESQQIAEAEAKAAAEAELKAFFEKGDESLGGALKDAEVKITTGRLKKQRNDAATLVQTKVSGWGVYC